MKIVAISDTHSHHRKVQIPDGDVFVCAGDISYRGELSIIGDFSNWLKELPHKHKVIIFGNHELGMHYGPNRATAVNMILDSGAHYLEDSSVTIDDVKFYGAPWQPAFGNWEFNIPRGEAIAEKWKLIDDDTNVLITHGPPYGILDFVEEDLFTPVEQDLHQGCEELRKRIDQLENLKASIFGHLHLNGGKTEMIRNMTFGNASICTEAYKPTNPAIVIEI